MKKIIPLFSLLILIFYSGLSQAQWLQTNGPFGGEIITFASSGNNVFAGTGGRGLYLSTNSGLDWNDVNDGLMHSDIESIGINGDNIFTTTWWRGGVFLSRDNGANWNSVNNGIWNSDVRALALSGDNIFAGTYGGGGVILSTNNGTSWNAVNNGLTNPWITSLAIDENNIFAGTYHGGIWRGPLSELVTSIDNDNENVPATFSLEQNYPNPFNPRTIINYELPITNDVELSIYNLIGQKMVTLVSERQGKGTYQVEWDASHFASGVYYYQLRTGSGFVQTRKLVLIK